MPTCSITTDLPAADVLDIVAEAGRDLGFGVRDHGDDELELEKGSFAGSIFLGAFMTYRFFRVFADGSKSGKRTRLEIRWNTPWWTGIIGCSNTRKAARELADAVEDDIEDRDGKVYDREDR
jgi:hypothetical protein